MRGRRRGPSAVNIREVLERASREVDGWPSWLRSADVEASIAQLRRGQACVDGAVHSDERQVCMKALVSVADMLRERGVTKKEWTRWAKVAWDANAVLVGSTDE